MKCYPHPIKCSEIGDLSAIPQFFGKSGCLYFRSPTYYILRGFDFQRTNCSFPYGWLETSKDAYFSCPLTNLCSYTSRKEGGRTELTREWMGKNCEEKQIRRSNACLCHWTYTYLPSINLAPNIFWQIGWSSRKRHELCPAHLLALFSSVLQTTVPLRLSLSCHCKWAEFYFQYLLVIVYFCIPGKGACCLELAFTIIYLCSTTGEGLTWELTNSIYFAKYLINWEKQWLLSNLFWLVWGLFACGFLLFHFVLFCFLLL